MTPDAFVVVEKITAAIEDQSVVVDLDALRVMRGMPVYQIDSGFIDECVCEAALLAGNMITPVAPPVDR